VTLLDALWAFFQEHRTPDKGIGMVTYSCAGGGSYGSAALKF